MNGRFLPIIDYRRHSPACLCLETSCALDSGHCYRRPCCRSFSAVTWIDYGRRRCGCVLAELRSSCVHFDADRQADRRYSGCPSRLCVKLIALMLPEVQVRRSTNYRRDLCSSHHTGGPSCASGARAASGVAPHASHTALCVSHAPPPSPSIR